MKVYDELNELYTLEEIREAVNNQCTCGGGGPEDEHTCPACQVWHELVLLANKEKP